MIGLLIALIYLSCIVFNGGCLLTSVCTITSFLFWWYIVCGGLSILSFGILGCLHSVHEQRVNLFAMMFYSIFSTILFTINAKLLFIACSQPIQIPVLILGLVLLFYNIAGSHSFTLYNQLSKNMKK